jgi:hypothetical protein
MKVLIDVGPMESYFGPFEDGVSVGARLMHDFGHTLVCPSRLVQDLYHRLRKLFWTHSMVFLGYEA